MEQKVTTFFLNDYAGKVKEEKNLGRANHVHLRRFVLLWEVQELY